MFLLLAALLAPQGESLALPPAPATATTVRATRTATPPVLDGRDDDAVWRTAPLIDQFLESRPSEGAAPKQRTEARVAYDSHNLYVFVRAFDSHPDSIVSLLSRRDDLTASDHITVMLDSYHDRRTGYEFSVNPAGVKTDYAIYNDGDEDVAWDAVWDVATRIDSLGWTAEYRIPLSQLRYSAGGDGTFGLLIWRVIATLHRHRHLAALPPVAVGVRLAVRRTAPGSTGLGSPGHAEITPYLVTKNVPGPGVRGVRPGAALDRGRGSQVPPRVQPAAQRDGQSRLRPGRGRSVGAQPRARSRPSSASGGPSSSKGRASSPFRSTASVVVDCSTGEGLFYSRRIGRSPQLADIYGDDASPTSPGSSAPPR